MERNNKVRVVFEFDRKDYDNVLFLIGATGQEVDEIEKVWEMMTAEDVILHRNSFADLGATPAEMLAMFVSFAITSVEDKVKSK